MSETMPVHLTIGQIRILHSALEKYIRNHAVIVNNEEFDINELGLIFSDLSRYCGLCKSLGQILDERSKNGRVQ